MVVGGGGGVEEGIPTNVINTAPHLRPPSPQSAWPAHVAFAICMHGQTSHTRLKLLLPWRLLLPPQPSSCCKFPPQVSDFNLTRVEDSSQGSSSTAGATNPRWLAPELLEGRGHTFASVSGGSRGLAVTWGWYPRLKKCDCSRAGPSSSLQFGTGSGGARDLL